MMESESKEAAMRTWTLSLPLQQLRPPAVRRCPRYPPPLQRQVTFHASNGVLNTT